MMADAHAASAAAHDSRRLRCRRLSVPGRCLMGAMRDYDVMLIS